MVSQGAFKKLIYMPTKIGYSEDFKTKLQRLLDVAKHYDFYLFNIDLSTDYQTCFALNEPGAFVDNLHATLY